jgi:hypothetical protein
MPASPAELAVALAVRTQARREAANDHRLVIVPFAIAYVVRCRAVCDGGRSMAHWYARPCRADRGARSAVVGVMREP